ncbi:DNA methyltransferase [Clostridia bacterium]|nr:DNA methyltransferase [Clostridia bacterium]
MSNLTLGSLFDGSGGFPLGAIFSGITPVWSSEVEPLPIRVTTKRLPSVRHLGDICKIDGGAIEPVDIITFGSPCQSFSIAGKRAGLEGKSGLFYEAVRVIREMRAATGGTHPRFAVMENVPGIFSSKTQGKSDFLEVLNELCKIKDEAISIPMPGSGKWLAAGNIVADNFSLAYRTIDAQHFGVAQRRRRCYLVVDFAGECAGEILFEREGVSRDFTPRFSAGQGTTGTSAGCAGDSIGFEPGALKRIGGHVWANFVGALRADAGDNRAAVAIPIDMRNAIRNSDSGDNAGLGIGADGEPFFTVKSGFCHAVAIENHAADSRVKIREDGLVQTLGATMGTGGGNVPLVASFMGGQGADAGSIAYSETVAPTLRGQSGGNSVPMVLNERQYALTVGEDMANTLTGTDAKGVQCLFEPKTLKIRSGCDGGGKGALVQENISATLGTSNDQTVFEPKAYGISSYESNAMKSANTHAGVYEAETSRMLDVGGGRPDCRQGGIVIAVQGSMIGRAEKNGPQGSGVCEGVSFTLTDADRHAICYQDNVGALCASDYKFPQNQQIEGDKAVVEHLAFGNNGHGCYNDKPATLKASGGDFPGGENIVVENRYVVRRLTPTECALLQGFPPTWCSDLETPEPTETDIEFWSDVWETHRKIMGKSGKPKSRKQIIKWLQHPHSDANEYKMWGNGVALPCVVFVLRGIVQSAQ